MKNDNISTEAGITRLLDIYLSGRYLSNKSKVFYPFFPHTHNAVKNEVDNLKKQLITVFNINPKDDVYSVLAKAIENNTNDKNATGINKSIIIKETYHPDKYQNHFFKPIRQFHHFVNNELREYLAGAYIHGSMSSMDYTGYSDFDTLFILKNDALFDSENIKKMEQRFIKSLKYLYKIDPLQHHGHFFLLESDLANYSQSFLPINVLQSATSLLDKGNVLNLNLLDRQDECAERFQSSIKILHRYLKYDLYKLKNPYFLKGILSHFMILPALFLQLSGKWVSKKESFHLLKKQVPEKIWKTMDQVSQIRLEWNQQTSSLRSYAMEAIGLWNPLLLSVFAQRYYKCAPINKDLLTDELFNDMLDFIDFLTAASNDEMKGS